MIETKAEMEFYQTNFDEKLKRSGWLEWEKKMRIGQIFYHIRQQDNSYLITAQTMESNILLDIGKKTCHV